jgi:hypothetical protein
MLDWLINKAITNIDDETTRDKRRREEREREKKEREREKKLSKRPRTMFSYQEATNQKLGRKATNHISYQEATNQGFLVGSQIPPSRRLS